MSYSVNITCPTCPTCGHTPSFMGWDPTYNLGYMFRAAGFDLTNFDGMTGAEAAPLLRAGIATMEADPAKFRALNPSNHWGDYDGILPVLRHMLAAFEQYPTGKIEAH